MSLPALRLLPEELPVVLPEGEHTLHGDVAGGLDRSTLTGRGWGEGGVRWGEGRARWGEGGLSPTAHLRSRVLLTFVWINEAG